MALCIASAVGAGLMGGRRNVEMKESEREYSDAGKFVAPKYATLTDMKAVSLILSLLNDVGKSEDEERVISSRGSTIIE